MSRILFVVLSLIFIYFPSSAAANCKDKPIVIAIVDTGFGFQGRGKEARLCPAGHRDFTGLNEFTTGYSISVPLDTSGHGTNIAGIIEKYAKASNINYCLIIVKFSQGYGIGTIDATIRAFNYLSSLHVNFINYSAGGRKPNLLEKKAVERLLNQGVVFVTAAGNDGENLDEPGRGYYPACYDKRIVVVGSLDSNGFKLSSSNYGSVVRRWEPGFHQEGYGLFMTGTSQAAATATGKLVSESKNKCR